MSLLKVDTITKADGTGSLSVPAETGTVVTTASPSLGRRNLIINGAMQVAQRGTSFTGYNIYTLDRWRTSVDVVPTQTISQEQQTDGTYVLLVNMTNGGISQVQQRIERGCNILSGKQVTFSYDIWGSGNIDVIAGDNASGANIHSESITVPSTRTRQSVTFTVPTQTSATDNMLRVGFGCRPTTNVRITNVQLEVGSVATPFEHRSYGEELALCQRYYLKTQLDAYTNHGISVCGSTTDARAAYLFNTRMRSSPSFSYSGSFALRGAGSTISVSSISLNTSDPSSAALEMAASGLTAGQAIRFYNNNDATAYLAFDAEL